MISVPKILRQAVNRLRYGWRPRGVILLYHCVSDSASDPYLLRVFPRHFEEHLRVIAEVGRPLQLTQLADAVRKGKVPDRAICVTFDDGYQDNLYTAKPLLERYDVPATVFMTTGSAGRQREFWWDELERVFFTPSVLPSRLELTLDGYEKSWELGTSCRMDEEDIHSNRAWTLLDNHAPTPRHALFREIYELIKPMNDSVRTGILDRLLQWAGMSPFVRQTRRALEPDEMRTLERGGVVEVGSHTVNHPLLPGLPESVQRDEIAESKAMLERWLGHPVESFAYPYGEYSRESIEAVGAAGFAQACSCISQSVRRDSQIFLLPRIEALNWDGEAFSRQLRMYIGGQG